MPSIENVEENKWRRQPHVRPILLSKTTLLKRKQKGKLSQWFKTSRDRKMQRMNSRLARQMSKKVEYIYSVQLRHGLLIYK